MKLKTYFHNVKNSASLEEKIREKSDKFDKWMEGKETLKWHCYSDERQNTCEVNMIGPHMELHAKASAEDFHQALGKAAEKLQKQLVKRKEKINEKLHRQRDELTCLDPGMAWIEGDEGDKKAA